MLFWFILSGFRSFPVNWHHNNNILLVELVIKHGHHIVSCSYRQPRRGCFSYSWCSLNGCAMHPTLLKAFNIVCIENLIISYHFKCQWTFHAFTKFGPQFNIYQPHDLTATGITQSSLPTQANEYLPWMKCSEHTRAPSYGACFLLSATSHLRRRSSSRGNFDDMR